MSNIESIIVSKKLLNKIKGFIDDAIFNHQADAVSLQEKDYKIALNISKELSKKLNK